MIDEHDPDVMCITCGLRTFSGCVCTRREHDAEEIENGRQLRMTRSELRTGNGCQLSERGATR